MDSYIFDDGSLESKVLQHEYPVTVIKVGPYNLNKWLSEVIEETDDIIKVYLHFCSSTLLRQDIDIRTDVAEALHNYPYLRIIMPYEQMDKATIERKALEYGISDKIKEIDFKSNKITAEEISRLYHEAKENYGKYSVGGNDSLRSEPKGRKSKKRED
jgi:hypothetical protein